MIQTQENSKKTNFGSDLGPLGPIFFFIKNLALSVTRYHGQLLSCKILKRTNDSILRKFSDGRANGRE